MSVIPPEPATKGPPVLMTPFCLVLELPHSVADVGADCTPARACGA